ncbi:23S rRNA methyltransferase [Nocardioides baekrokdamisoli]|uniref:23S rRNA methyltransferase n=1 Tax=Nocardioides baekrokdamisoli TaxID=1804624 RepID=A0A3G9IUS2_9ACTN|nr:TRAM domain-containing protein [Nocardioides baekrokdamisoli]BBH15973.1 23S rRNA methyltransferase [Nocardioides baekrokdamisoli]
MKRHTRPRQNKGASHVGERFEVEVGPVAHGGFWIARHEGRVIFVRHALTGEKAIVEVTEGSDGDTFWRADAVEILEASPDRVQAPCEYARPGGCGGCDFQHVAVTAQRDLKAQVIKEQFRRLAKLEVDITVQPVHGDKEGLRWRTRQTYVGPGKGMRKHRSHDVIQIDDCLIARHDAREGGEGSLTETVDAAGTQRTFQVAADGFWQVHPGAPTALVEAVLDALQPQSGESVLDLYSGVGLFSSFLAERGASVTAIEGEKVASEYGAGNVLKARSITSDVAAWLALNPGESDLVVLDPPRAGAGRKVVTAIADRSPRAIAYVACDPAALARDVATFAELGYRMSDLKAFDLFPMTHHVESVALLVPDRVLA